MDVREHIIVVCTVFALAKRLQVHIEHFCKEVKCISRRRVSRHWIEETPLVPHCCCRVFGDGIVGAPPQKQEGAKGAIAKLEPERRVFASSSLDISVQLLVMSLIATDSLKAIAESVGIADLSDDVAKHLAPDVEYRLREIAQVCHESEPLHFIVVCVMHTFPLST